jgi:hypothetical protein
MKDLTPLEAVRVAAFGMDEPERVAAAGNAASGESSGREGMTRPPRDAEGLDRRTALVAATEEAIARYNGDIDVHTGERVDDWGYSESERQAFVAGTLWSKRQHEANAVEAFGRLLYERYPADVFPVPSNEDMQAFRDAAKATGRTLDRFSAEIFRRAAAQAIAAAAEIREEP